MITSFRNPLVKRIKRLRQKKYRQQEGEFWVEGIRPVLTALEHGAEIAVLVVAPELLTSPTAHAAVASQKDRDTTVATVSGAVFAAISERDRPVGLGAIIRLVLPMIADLPIWEKSLFVALHEVTDPGNLGTIIRTADATGVQGVILVGNTVDPFHPQAVKAGMGTLFTVPVVTVDSLADLIAWSTEKKLFTIASSVQAKTDYRVAIYRYPALLIMGSEGEGLDPETIRSADCAVTIPMRGSASSLNLAVASGILLYEIAIGR
jgi:TrmH family RNA methyltransferase